MRLVDLRGWLVLALCLSWGCGDECSKAVSLCEDCDAKPESCEVLFEDASADFCREAVDDYEASCGE